MNKQEALSIFLNKSIDQINLDMYDSYTDNDTGIRYEIYTQKEALDKVKEIILNNLYLYNKEYLMKFMDIADYNIQNYSQNENSRSILKILENQSIDPKDKNRLIMSLLVDFNTFFESDISKNNGFGGYFQSLGNKEHYYENYLIYLYQD